MNSEPDAGKKNTAGAAKAAEFDEAIRELVARKNAKEGEITGLKEAVRGLTLSLQKAEIDYKVAQSRTSAAATGRVDVGRQDEQSFTATSQVAKEIAGVVTAINKSYLRDHCFTLVSEMVRKPEMFSKRGPAVEGTFDPLEVIKTTLLICNAVLLEQAPTIAATQTSEPQHSTRSMSVNKEVADSISRQLQKLSPSGR